MVYSQSSCGGTFQSKVKGDHNLLIFIVLCLYIYIHIYIYIIYIKYYVSVSLSFQGLQCLQAGAALSEGLL